MKFDFSIPMTSYEMLAVVLSIIAILIPIIQMVWKKWIIQEKLNFLSTGTAFLYFNQSGSYLRIDGVYESVHKPVSIKQIAVKVTRQKDDRKLNLQWSSFISPVNQKMMGNYVQTMESAHPFRIEADGIMYAFVEFADPFDSFGKKFKSCTEDLFNSIPDIRKECPDYLTASHCYKAKDEFIKAKSILNQEFFWEIGEYQIEIIVLYGKKQKTFSYTMSIGESEHNTLLPNIDESLLLALKGAYGINGGCSSTIVNLIGTK